MSGARRIRTLKPEMLDDPDFGRLSYPAQTLWVGLITMADDEGRFLALTSGIVGNVFKFKAEDATQNLSLWIAEIRKTGSVLFYKADRLPYGAFKNWAKHQLINRPSPSSLPDPPDPGVVRDNGLVLIEGKSGDIWKQHLRLTEKDVIVHGSFTESSLNDHGTISDDSRPRVRARAGGRRSDPFIEEKTLLLTEKLSARVRENDPKAKINPESHRWLTDMRLLLQDRGGDDDAVQEIGRIIDWCSNDRFERANILSPGKLRDRFTQLLLKAAGSPPAGKAPRVETTDELLARRGVAA